MANDYLNLLQAAPAAAPSNPYLGLLQDEANASTTRFRASTSLAVDSDPDKVARARRVAGYLGTTPAAVDALPADAERAVKLRTLDDNTAAAPVLRQRYTDQDFAKLAHDDSGVLSTLESSIAKAARYVMGASPDGGLPQDIYTGAVLNSEIGAAGLFRGVADLAAGPFTAAFGENNPLRHLAEGFGAIARRAQAEKDRLAPGDSSIFGGGVQSGVQSGFQAMKYTPLALLGPPGIAAALAGMVGETGGTTYQADREKGIGVLTSTAHASADMVAEYTTEKYMGAAGLLQRIAAGSPVGKLAMYEITKEVPGEVAATLWQNFNEWALTNPEKSVRDFINEQPAAVGQTIVATLVGGGVQIGASKASMKLAEQVMGRQFETERAARAAEVMQQQLAAALESKLRERSPQDFRAAVQAMADGTPDAPKAVYVDAEVLNQLAPEVQQLLPGQVLDEMRQALASGDSVAIPLGDVLALAPGTTLEQTIVDHGRIGDPMAPSRAEAKQATDQAAEWLNQEAAGVIAQAQDIAAMQDSSDRVGQAILAQLQSLGQFRQAVNEGYATWAAAFYTTMGARMGLSAEDFYQRYPLRVLGEQPGAQGVVLNGQQFGQDERDLIVTHNLTADNLLHVVKMGGIPVPSLAITKKDTPLTGFGEITLVGSEAMADPKGYAKTKVFGADIYSPRYPSVERELDKKALAALRKEYGPLEEQFASRLPDQDDLQRNGQERMERSPVVMAKFLREHGIEPQVVFRAGMDEKRIERLESFGLGPYLDRTDFFSLMEDEQFVKAALAEIIDTYEQLDGKRAALVEKLRTDETTQRNFVKDTAREIANAAKLRKSPELDTYASQSAMEKQIEAAGLANQYQQFVADALTSITKSERIFQGFTNAGNRKYIPHTLENVVKILKTELRGGENFNYGVGSLRAKFTPQFKSVAEIRKNKDRLITAAEFEKAKDEIDAEFNGVAQAMSGEDNGRVNSDTVVAILEDAPKKGLERAAKEYAVELTPQAKEKAVAFLNKLHDLPTAYFEAKILRDVSLSEFKAAVVPEGTPKAVIDALAAAGVTQVTTYAKGDEADRAAKISGAADAGGLLFQGDRGPRGTFNPRTLDLVLNPHADLSTFFHETGHFFLEVLADVGTQPDSPLAGDWAKVLNWFGVTAEQWAAMSLDEKRPYHERWAESVEQYIMEGKAPSRELQPLMRKFSAWLKQIYGSIKQFLESRGQATSGPVLGQSVARGRIRRTVDELVAAAESQKDWKTWYARHEQVLVELFGNDADLFQKILSATSQATGVKGNVSLALKAYDQLLSGEPFTGYLPAVIKNLDRIRNEQALEGAKISQYGKANEGDAGAIAVDRHIAMLFFNTKTPSAKQIDSAKKRIRKIADRLGWEPRQVQASLWAFNQVRLGTDPSKVESYDKILEARADFIVELRARHGRGEGGGLQAGGATGAGTAEGLGGQPGALAQDPAAKPGPPMALNDDIRRVMDRMLATDEQIAQANEVAGLVPNLEADAEAAERMNKRSIADLKWDVRALDKAIAKLRKHAKSLEKGIREEVTAEVNAMPEVQAKDMLTKSRRENGGELNDTERAIIADAFGYESVDTMLKAIDAFGSKKDAIEGLTSRRMLEEHGDLIDERAIKEAAIEAVHNKARAKSLATELKAQADMLGQRAGTGQTNAKGSRVTVSVIEEAARQFGAAVVARTPLKDLKAKAWQHTAAERRASTAWQKATAAGDTAGAVKAKQDQLLNNAAAKAAMDAMGEANKIIDFFKRVAKDGNEATVEKGRDPDVVNAARAVLAAYGVGTAGAKSALDYLAIVEKNDPAMWAAIQPTLQDAMANAQPLQALTMEQLQGLFEEIQALWHLAKRSRQMEINGKLIPIEDAEQELKDRMQAIGVPDSLPGESGALTPAETRARWLQFAGSILRRVEQWAEGMDGAYGGPFLRLVFHPVKAAADAYRADRVVYRKAYQDLVDAVAPSLRKGLIDAPELGYTFGRGHNGIGHAELLHALLHTGNASNLRKLLLGRQWATLRADGTMDTQRWDAFIARMQRDGTLTRAHYDFAQGVWDLLERTKPLAQKAHRDVFGRYFDEVAADAFSTPWGDYRGGYVPAQADPRIVQDADLRNLASIENENMSFSFPTTSKGFTKGRVEYNRPLMLDLRTIGQHIDKVLLFAHMEPAVRDVNKLLSRKAVSQPLGKIDPTAYAGMLTPWLNRSARQIVETPIVGDGGISRVLSAARSRAGMALMFANVSNTLQQVTGFAGAFAKLKADGLKSDMLKATALFISHPRKMAAAVAAASPYMAHRMDNEIAAINGAMNDILLDPSLYERAQAWTMRHAYFLQSALDNTMGPIIWTSAYNGALGKGLAQDEAARYADGVIRQTQGSTLPEDVSRIETGPAYARVFTQFIGYFNMMANTNATAVKQIAQDVGLKRGAGKALMLVTLGMMVPIWVAEAIAQGMRGGPDDPDGDGWLDDWLAAVFGMGTIKGAFAMVPFVGQLANAAVNRFNANPADDRMSLTPVVSLLEGAAGVPWDAYKALKGEGNARNTVRDVASAVSIATGLPATAIARPLGYLAGVESGKILPTGPVDAARGAITGSASPASTGR